MGSRGGALGRRGRRSARRTGAGLGPAPVSALSALWADHPARVSRSEALSAVRSSVSERITVAMRRMLRLLGLDDAEHDLPAVDATSPSVIGAGLSLKGE